MAINRSVLVTRPEGQGQFIGEALRQRGWQPVFCPMLQIEPLLELSGQQRQLIRDLAECAHVIFVSANAARLGMECIESGWPQLPVDLQWYTVGNASAAVLADFGVHAQQPQTEFTSEGLLALPALQSVAGQRVLIIKGEGGRQHLQQSLQERGARVDELALYRRRCPDLGKGELASIIQAGRCEAMLLSSGEGLRNMVSLLQQDELPAVQALVVVVPGSRVADEARELGFGRVVCAANATDAAMIEALQQAVASGG